MNLFKVNGKFDLKKLIVSFLVTFVTALIGTIASIGAKEYYSTLNQPAFAPPGAVFAPVWTILFLLMATAAYRIWSYGLMHPGVHRLHYNLIAVAILIYINIVFR